LPVVHKPRLIEDLPPQLTRSLARLAALRSKTRP
jgi:hypothetical protein